MSIRKILVRVMCWTVVSVLAVVVGLFVFVQVEQHLLRWRADRLLGEIQEIQMGKSTWADAQKMMTEWGEWGHWPNKCSEDSCDYFISQRDYLRQYPVFAPRELGTVAEGAKRYPQWIQRGYLWLGGRSVLVFAEIRVRHGVIQGKSFYLMTDLNRPWSSVLGERGFLLANTEGLASIVPNHFNSSHPEYIIHSWPCTVCTEITVEVTPYADNSTLGEVYRFDLRCITRWLPCQNPKQIMPSAWSLLENDKQGHSSKPIIEPIEFQTRDYPDVYVIESLGKTFHSWYGTRTTYLKFRVVDNLKSLSTLPIGQVFEFRYSGDDADKFMNKNLESGNQLILLFDERQIFMDDSVLGLVPENIFPATPENLRLAKNGVARDLLRSY
jgi:hypothetical protein